MPSLNFSHDPEAGTLYCYFTELQAGQVQFELEYPTALLLDRHDRVLGLRVDLDDDITLDQLELALDLPGIFLNERGQLKITVGDDEPARAIGLAETALLDLDADGICLGIEIVIPDMYRNTESLVPLAALMIPLDDAVIGREGPVVFAMPTATAEDQAASDAGAISPTAPTEVVRSGFVALVGKPNVGKSTLLNQLLGQKVAIVSPRPQTTRVPLRGILNRADAQIIFIDTPGIHDPRHKLGELMVDLARRVIPEADVICFMVDITAPPSRLDRQIAAQLQRARAPRLLLLNKVDQKPQPGRKLDPAAIVQAYRELGEWDMELAISARSGAGLPALLDELIARLPQDRRLYPSDQIADQSEQQLVAELLREKVLRFTEHEVPHAVAIEVDEWEQQEQRLYIRMSINVERDSQKGIIIGAGGQMLKQIGSAARSDIERLLDQPVFLDIWVKVRPNWRDDPASLNWLGYRRKDHH
jgi:GTPase